MKRMVALVAFVALGGLGGLVLVACGSEPPPQAVMVPEPSAAPPVAPAPMASVAPVAEPAPPASADLRSEGQMGGPPPADPAAPSGSGTGQGFGLGHGRLSTASTKPPSVRQGATTVNGRLPPEVIQRIVRQNFGRFRLCYENALKTDAALKGKVVVKFVIDKSGSVVNPADSGSDIGNAAMVSCVVKGFGNLSFPQPEGGIVTVVYPVLFDPGG